MSTEIDVVTECHECGLVQSHIRIPRGGAGKCSRCGAVLYRDVKNSIETTLLLTLASLILFVIASTFPMLTFNLDGREQANSLISGVIEIYDQGYWELAVVVCLTSVLFPFLRIAGMLYVLVPVHFNRNPRKLGPVFLTMERLLPWAMVEVYMLGILVAITKLSSMATIEIGIAVYAFSGLIVLTVATSMTLDARLIWSRLGPDTTSTAFQRNQKKDFVGCHGCDLLVHVPKLEAGHGARCPRCHSRLHRRKTNSVARCWALLMAAIICYIPANMLPIMTVISFGEGEPDTILSGVIALIALGMYPVAILILFASITVPVLKMAALMFITVSVQRSSDWRNRDRTFIYRMTEAVGRWSMVDIFMVSILAALVKLDALATIEPGPGAVFFAAVVIITMIAAMSFDPRLVWDKAGENDG